MSDRQNVATLLHLLKEIGTLKAVTVEHEWMRESDSDLRRVLLFGARRCELMAGIDKVEFRLTGRKHLETTDDGAMTAKAMAISKSENRVYLPFFTHIMLDAFCKLALEAYHAHTDARVQRDLERKIAALGD